MQNQIPKNWQKVKLGDLLREGTILQVQDGNHGEKHPKQSDFVKNGERIPFIMANDLNSGKIDFNNCNYISKKQADNLRIGFAKSGDVLLTHKGNLGLVSIVPEMEFDYLMLTPQVTYYRVDKKKLDNKFLKYVFLNPSFQKELQNISPQSTRPYVGITAQRDLEISFIEDIQDQKKIASILSAFDDKIEINNKIAKALEGIAQALFKEWFVNFKFPVYENLEFVDSELGNIPEGWTVGILNNFIGELESGKRPKGGVSVYTEGIPSIGAENVDGLENSNFSNIKLIPENFFDSMNLGIIKDYDILIYKDGGVPGIFKVKFTIIGQGYPFSKAAINEHLFRLQANKLERQFYLFFYLNLRKSIKYFESVGGKAAVPGINSTDFKNLPLLMPSEDIIKSFHKLVSPMIKKILNTKLQNQKLATMRDLLLSKLMIGEIRV